VPACAGRGPPLRFCAPSEVHHRTPAPSRRSEDRHLGRCFLSWTLLPFDTSRDGGPVSRGASGPAACRVRGLGTSIATSTPIPAGAFRHRSVRGLHPSRPSPRADGYPFRDPCPRAVLPVDSPRPHGERADESGFRASCPARARADSDPRRDPNRRCLPGFLPSRAFPPPVPAFRFRSRSLPSHAFERRDVHIRLRHRVFGYGGIGWSLSGLPALLGSVTLRPSRRRCARRGGRAHGFASRLGRVASGPNRSMPPPTEPTEV
jgi:hypothetical protein